MDDTQFQALLSNLKSGISNGEMTDEQPLDEFDKVAKDGFGIQPKPVQKPKVDIASQMVRNPVEQPKVDIASHMVRNPDVPKPRALTDLSPEQKAVMQGFNPTGVPTPGFNLPGQREKFKMPNDLPATELTQGRSLWDKIKAPSIYDISNRYAEPTLRTATEAGKFVPIVGQGIVTAEGTGMMGAQAIEDATALYQGRDAKQVFTPSQTVGKALEVAGEAGITSLPGKKLSSQVGTGFLTGGAFGSGGALQTGATPGEAVVSGIIGAGASASMPLALKGAANLPIAKQLVSDALEKRALMKQASKESGFMKIAQEIFSPPPAATSRDPRILQNIRETAGIIEKAKSFEDLVKQLETKKAKIGNEIGGIVNKNQGKVVTGQEVYQPLRDKISALKSDPQTAELASTLEDILQKELEWKRKNFYTEEIPLAAAQERKVWLNNLLGDFYKKSDTQLTDLEASKIMAFDELRRGYMTALEKQVPEIGGLNHQLGALSSTMPLIERQRIKSGNALTKRGLSGIIDKIPGIGLLRKVATGKVGVDDILGTRAATVEGELGDLTSRLGKMNKAGITKPKIVPKKNPTVKSAAVTRAGFVEEPQLSLQERKDVVRLGQNKPSTMKTEPIVKPKAKPKAKNIPTQPTATEYTNAVKTREAKLLSDATEIRNGIEAKYEAKMKGKTFSQQEQLLKEKAKEVASFEKQYAAEVKAIENKVVPKSDVKTTTSVVPKKSLKIKRYYNDGFETTDKTRGGTWFFVGDGKIKPTGIGGGKSLQKNFVPQKSKTFKVNDVMDRYRDADVESFIGDKYAGIMKNAQDLITTKNKRSVSADRVAKYLKSKGIAVDLEDVNTGNIRTIVEDKVIAHAAREKGFDSIILDAGKEKSIFIIPK
jgi:hypothetical protein